MALPIRHVGSLLTFVNCGRECCAKEVCDRAATTWRCQRERAKVPVAPARPGVREPEAEEADWQAVQASPLGEVILPYRDLPQQFAEGNLDGDHYWIVGSSQ